MFDKNATAEQVTEGIDLSGQNWLITGVNSGLGRESARVLAMRGAHILGAARTQAKAIAAFSELGIEGTPIASELSELSSIRQAVDSVKATGRPLHGILANAGIMALPELQQKDGFELQFYTNHVGHFALITGLTDALAERGRVVVLSSAAHRMAKERGIEFDNLSGEDDYHGWRMYGRSKLANIYFTRSLARRLARGQTANSVHPGVINTNLGRSVPNMGEMYERMKDRMKTVEQGAATQCYVATSPDLDHVSGRYFSDCNQKAPIGIATDDDIAETLWERTEAILAASR